MIFLRDRVALFSGVTGENLAALAEASVMMPFHAGQTILFKGATCDGLHIIVEGKAGVYVKSTNKTMVRVAELVSGEVFGEMSIVEMGTAGATIKAEADETMIMMIPQDTFRHVLQQDEGFAVRVNMLITGRRSAPTSVPA
jgi:CRP-like cAMP-binding protein